MNKINRALIASAIALTCAQNASAAKTLNILIPSDYSDWVFDTPMISMDGGKTGKAMSADPNHCGWFSFTFENQISDDVVIFRNGDIEREDMIGLNGNWESGFSATPIPLAALFAGYDKDELFFVSDQELFLDVVDNGWYTAFPKGVEGTCKFQQSLVSYSSSKTEIDKLEACGASCVTDKKKLSEIFGSEMTGSCSEKTFERDADNMWTYTYDKRYDACTSLRTSFIAKPGTSIQVVNASLAWIFIDGKQVQTTKGYHDAVVMNVDSTKTASGERLVIGNQYNLEVFYCDQNSSLDNVQISSNLDQPDAIQYASSITVSPQRTNGGETSYELCYTQKSSNTCYLIENNLESERTICGDDFKKSPLDITIRYYLVKGSTFDARNAELLVPGTLNKGGIDLTNPYLPKINKKAVATPPGRWTLFVKIDGTQKKLTSFRTTGEIDILAADKAEVLDSNGAVIKDLSYSFNNEIVAGVPTPVYVSAITSDNDKFYLLPDDAVGVSYAVYTDNPSVHLYTKTGENEYSFIDGQARTVGNSGVDTVYVYMDKDNLEDSSKEASIFINGIDSVKVQFKAGSIPAKYVMGIQAVAAKSPTSQNYAVYDMKGKLVKRGMTTDGSNITVPTSGTYIIRTGNVSKVMRFK